MRLIEGDCLEVLKTLPEGSVDAVITDPPYGRNQEWHHGRVGAERSYRVAGDDSAEAAIFVRNWASARELPLVVFMSPYLQLLSPWQQLLVWDKGGAVGGGGDVRRTLKQTWELIGVERATLYGPRRSAVFTHHVTPSDFRHHRCQKPLGLMRDLIRCFVPPGGTVLDPFAGSGTTGIACMHEGRDAILIERVPEYCDIIRRRLKDEEAKCPLFTKGGTNG